MAFYTGCEIRDKALIGHRGDQEYSILDDMAVLEFFRDNSGKSSAEFAANFLGREDFFGQNLNEIEGLTEAITAHLEDIHTLGMRAALCKTL
jgi:tagaturonate reductase